MEEELRLSAALEAGAEGEGDSRRGGGWLAYLWGQGGGGNEEEEMEEQEQEEEQDGSDERDGRKGVCV